MRFWDSYALVSLLVSERRSPTVEALCAADAEMMIWWASRIECASAIHRLRRESTLTMADAGQVLQRLDEVQAAAAVVKVDTRARR